jgi:hypothetical protein
MRWDRKMLLYASVLLQLADGCEMLANTAWVPPVPSPHSLGKVCIAPRVCTRTRTGPGAATVLRAVDETGRGDAGGKGELSSEEKLRRWKADAKVWCRFMTSLQVDVQTNCHCVGHDTGTARGFGRR